MWLLLPLYGGYTALTDGVGKAWIADLLPQQSTGTGLGLYQGIAGGAVLIAGVWAGLAWGETGRLPLVVSGAVAATLALLLALTGWRLESTGSARAMPAHGRAWLSLSEQTPRRRRCGPRPSERVHAGS